MKHTLITMDMTKNCINTIVYGVGFTNSLGLRAKLLHFLNQLPKSMVVGYPDSPSIRQELFYQARKRRAKDGLIRVAQAVNRKFNRPVIASHKVIAKHAESGILEASENDDSALVVLGAIGKDDWLSKVVGSTPSAVAIKTDVPALVVPKGQTFTGIKKVLLVVPDEDNDMEILKPVLSYLKCWKASTKVLDVTGNDKQTSMTGNLFLDKMMRSKGNTFSVAKGASDPEAILKKAKDMEADLIVLPYQKTGFFEGLFKANLSKELILNSKIPVMVC